MRILSMDTKWFLRDWIKQESQGKCPELVFGIYDDTAKRRREQGAQFVYLDHAYFNRGWHRGMFRAVRNDMHLTRLIERPDDRLRHFGVEIQPWRKTGRYVLVIQPSAAQAMTYGINEHLWLVETLDCLAESTNRPVVIKYDKRQSLASMLPNAWAVVTYASVAGVESAVAGVPVFSTPNCPSWPICAGTLDRIDTPHYSECRHQWASGLAYASWHVDEIGSVQWKDYQYSMQ